MTTSAKKEQNICKKKSEGNRIPALQIRSFDTLVTYFNFLRTTNFSKIILSIEKQRLVSVPFENGCILLENFLTFQKTSSLVGKQLFFANQR